jgi:signal transduction histidine kinase
LTSIIEKRVCLHRKLANQQEQNDALKADIIQLQGLANLGIASYMIAHEINNLLTPLASYASLALKDPDDKALVEKALRKTIRNCERATKVMESMLAMASGQTQDRENTRLIGLVEGVFTCLCRDFAKDGITVEIQIPEGLTVWAVPVQIQQVLMNLVLNARDAMLPNGGVLTIKAAENADSVCIEVRDTGTGVDPANLENIFESFFTTKADESSPTGYSGSGLGLAFCKKIVDAHDGCISVESKPREGSIFKIALPLGK